MSSNPLQNEWRRSHPDWTHRPVEWTREQWARLARIWTSLVECQNGQDVDDYAFPEDGGHFGAYLNTLRLRIGGGWAEVPPRLLVLGCGVGHDLAWARANGWNATGITLGPMNVAVAREWGGVPPDAIRFEDMHLTALESGSFDAAIGLHVLEHSWAPLMLLLEVARLLRPGGWAFFRTPQAQDFTGGQELHHVLCPTPRQVRGLMEKAGFKGVEATVDGVEDVGDTLAIGRRWREDEDVTDLVREFTR